jgi:hypothetical protein
MAQTLPFYPAAGCTFDGATWGETDREMYSLHYRATYPSRGPAICLAGHWSSWNDRHGVTPQCAAPMAPQAATGHEIVRERE